jgi:hypothetical protein
MKIFRSCDMRKYLKRQFKDDMPQVIDRITQWLAWGDFAAVYENTDLYHPELGKCQLASFGSGAAMLEPVCNTCKTYLERTETPGEYVHVDDIQDNHTPVYPPVQMPDIGDSANWRYHLVGIYTDPVL